MWGKIKEWLWIILGIWLLLGFIVNLIRDLADPKNLGFIIVGILVFWAFIALGDTGKS
ncbi:MAG: hypothetical protein RKO66_15360 [Candidatus Contendobacter sp.]|nr:hypothetical protein [Candidatus Contendobacter sp.]